MSRQIRFAALLLAVSILCNMALPAMAVESADTPVSVSDGKTTAPTEETTAPTEETTAPTEETTAPIEETTAPIEEITYPMPFEQPEDNTLYITTARELLRLSYVEPQEYGGLTLVFDPGDEGDAVFDLATETDDPAFLGLGSEEYPFQGEILFAEEAGPIVLNRPLFNALSDDAKITGLSLESRIQGAAEGGLLAQTVTHGQGGNAWSIILTKPELAKDAEVNLLPLISELGNDVDVSLDLADLSGLAVLGSGYLCAVMGENARVTLSGVQSIPSVTSESNEVGGLVGQMKSGASLTVLGESIGLGGVSGSWNVGGIVGSAVDPILTLPAVEGGSGTSVCGENVGGLVGRLTCSPGDHALALSVSGLTLEGSGSVGGLFGVLRREEGSVTLNARADGINFVDGAENCGSLIGAYYANSLENSLKLNGVLIADDAGLEAIAGFVDYPGKPENTEAITAAEEAQAIIDSIRNAELRPGEMSSFWWAVVCEKITAEDLEAEIAAAYPGSAEDQEADASSGAASYSRRSAAASFSQRSAAPIAQDEEAEVAALALLEAGISAYAEPTALPWPENQNKYEIKSASDLVLLSYVTPGDYANGTITIDTTSSELVLDLTASYDMNGQTGLSFRGLCDAANPFTGTLVLSNAISGTYIKLNRPLFNALSDGAAIERINLYSGLSELPASNSEGLLAVTVKHGEGDGTKPWGINLQGISDQISLPLIGTMSEGSIVKVNLSLRVGKYGTSTTGNTENTFNADTDCSGLTVQGGGYLCTKMEGNAQLTATLIEDTTTALGVPKVSGSGSVGGLVGTMEAGASLTVKAGGSLPIMGAESTVGNAGGLVGTMGDAASVTVTLPDDAALTLSNVTAKKNAGGLIGEAINPVLKLPAITGGAGITIKSTDSDAGGVIGKLTVNPGSPGKSYNLTNTIENLTLSAGQSAGGLFGLLVNDGGTYTISGTNVNVTFSGVTKAGGLIGSYRATNLSDALILNGNTTTSTQGNGVTKYGGLIGYVYEKPAYIQISSGTVTTNQTAKPTCYGGLIAELTNHGHFVQVGGSNSTGITITPKYVKTENKFAGNNAAGGLVGAMPSGVLALDVQPSIGSDIEGPNDKRGWVLGERGNTLVYTTVANWTTPADAKNTNDTGVWGQVLRADQLQNLITPNTDHTVTVAAPASGVIDNAATINNVFDFAAVALRLQLNPTGALGFETADFDSTNTVSITLSENIDLRGNELTGFTGLTGLTRDVNSTEVFNLTITGSGKTITLPDLKVYASANGHDRQGLIGKAGILNVTGLTVDGYVKTHVLSGDIYAGALLAEAAGATILTSVTSAIQMTISGGNSENCAYAGLVAMTSSNVTFTSCQLKAGSKISDETNKVSYVAGFLAYGKNTITITVGNCEVHGTVEKTIRPDKYARISGLITTLYDGTFTLNISNLTVSDLTVRVPADFDKTCGGLLGYEWMKTTATISGVTITGCTLNAGKATFGGLVYKGSGYWKVSDSGISFNLGEQDKVNTFSGQSSADSPSGLLVCRANVEDNGKGALYLEIQHGAYSIAKKGEKYAVEVNIGDSGIFDEIAGRTIHADGNGIVSIGTAADNQGKRLIDQNGCNTYQKQLSTDYNNPNTRYYYNLDTFRTDVTGDIDTPEEMVVLSARGHCHSTLQNYFTLGNNKITGDNLNLTGYSYYPIPFSGQFISNATITFDYQGLETAEQDNKMPSNKQRQHNGMHTGLFTNVGSTTAGASLTIDGLTLRGTVGGSAIINGTARGGASTAMTALNISNVTLDGIRTVPAGGSPLLINSIESFTKLNLTDVTTTNSYSDLGNAHAATSLIGKVGETSGNNQVGQYIQLDFAQIALDGRIAADSNSTTVHNTTRSIFSTALFLQEFQYVDSNSWGVYNFTKVDEENREKYYTLGAELSNGATEKDVRNGGEQFYFYGSATAYVYLDVNPSAAEDGSEAATFFKDKYLRYVGNKETGTYHEMDINLLGADITNGCGTYSDPYIITNGKQLLAVANVLKGLDPKKNWTITMNIDVLGGGSFAQNSHSTDVHKKYSWNDQWMDKDGNALDSDINAGKEQVINYLRNAYYQLEGNGKNGNTIKLSSRSGWGGLGSKDHPFRGVIVDKKDENGNPTATVRIDAPSATQFGGLIAFSEGSVVKDVKIQYDQAPSIAGRSVPSTIDAPFFGGVVGWCIGGDTIIDGVSVTYDTSKAPKVTDTYAYLVPVGGYVGMVGGTEGFGTTSDGLGGGVVFRGTNTSNLSSVSVGSTSVTPSGDSNYFYVNPYVGRVLDGYAITEGTEFINTDKNYQIPNISVDENGSCGLSFNSTTNTIQVSNAQGLWLLSAIVNSGAGSGTATGKARVCDYGSVGQAMPDGEGADEASDASPYLIRKYGLESVKDKISKGAVSIELTGDCDMSSYGNGFRGIGGSYGGISNEERLLNVSSISSPEGKKYAITLGQNRKEYTAESQTWTSLGAGLFPVLNPATNFTAQRLTLAGTTGISYYDKNRTKTVNPIPSNGKLMDAGSYRLGCSGAGLLAGTMKKAEGKTSTISLTNIKITGSVTGSATFAGGLIGLACINNSSKNNCIIRITVENCNYSGASVEGFACVGGFFGYAYADSISITANSEYPMAGITVESSAAQVDAAKTGIGALMGRCGVKELTIGSNDINNRMTFSGKHEITNQNTTATADTFGTGGLAGILGIRQDGTVAIQNIAIGGTLTVSNNKGNNSSGILAGFLACYNFDTSFNNDGFTWNDGKKIKATISNIQIAPNGNDATTVKNTKQGGVLFGATTIATASLEDISIGSEQAKVTIASEGSATYSSLGGLIGTVAKTAVSLTNAVLTNVNVWGNPGDANRGPALLFSFVENSSGTNIRNVKLKGCNVAVQSEGANAGLIYAELKGSTVNGYNILIDDCRVGLSLAEDNTLAAFTAKNGDRARIGLKYGDTYTPYSGIPGEAIGNCTSAGNVVLFGGKTDDQTAKLVGVSVKNCKTPMKEFGDGTSAKRYAVRADYTGQAGGDASQVTTVPTLNLPGITLTGDGIGLTTTTTTENGKEVTTKTPYSKQIVTDGATATNRTYFNVTTEIGKFNTGDYKDCISTFLTAGESTVTQTDFPVLVINSNEGINADTIVRNYISLLTNVPKETLLIPINNIGISCYYWRPAAGETPAGFTKDTTNSRVSLKVVNGKLTTTPSGYDNQRNQFTLVHVTYDDPTQGGNNAYHLYIPVIVKQVMEFKFWASAENGSSYNVTHYGGLEKSAIGSNKDLFTSLLTFEYQWDKTKWQSAVNSGLDLLWNFDKEVIFAYNTKKKLPANTRLTLVDCNNKDQAYFGTYTPGEGPNYDYVGFSSFETLSNVKWKSSDVPLCSLLNLTPKPYDEKLKQGKFVKCDPNGATLRDKHGNYYRPATDGDRGDFYSIEVGYTGDYVKETYYLTIQTQFKSDEDTVYNFMIQCDTQLKNPDGKSGLPTTQVDYAENKQFAQNNTENRVIISNFYTQKIQVSTGDSVAEMSSLNDSISGTLDTTVTFLSDDGYEIFDGQKDGRELKQQFCLSLKDQDNNPVPFPAGTTIQIGDTWYPIEPGYTFWLPVQEVKNWQPNDKGLQCDTVSTAFTLHFTADGIYSTFPVRAGETSTDGIQVSASSSLSLNEDALKRSNQKVSGTDSKRFFRKEMSLATLFYNAYDIAYPTQATGLSNLGINGWETSSAALPSAAIYDASAVQNVSNAKKIRCTVELLKKNNSGGYDKVATYKGDPGQGDPYLDSIVIDPKVSVGGVYVSAQRESGFDFTIGDGQTVDWHAPVQIDVDLQVRSGKPFESGSMYANYKVLLTAELLTVDPQDNTPKLLEGSRAYDYIIYTNTKIVKELIP